MKPDLFRRHLAALALAAAGVLRAPALARAEPEKAAPAAPPIAKPAAPERAAIEAVLSAMRDSVLAGDGAAYLRHVVPAAGAGGDAVFRREQENWAKDLKDHVPVEFDLAIADVPAKASADEDGGPAEPVFTPTRAQFELKMIWKMKPQEGRPPPRRAREISFPAVFVRMPGAEGDGQPGNWLYAGEDWVVVEGEEGAAVRAKCMKGFEKAARDAVAVFPEVRTRVEEGFEQKIPHVQEIKIYASMRHLQQSIYLSYVDALGGWNEPGESIKILAAAAGSRAALRPLLAHEFGHVATFEYGPHATDMPWWILEGVAEISGGAFSRNQWNGTQRLVKSWAKSDGLADWNDITDFRNTKPALHQHVYRQGEHMLGYISERFGRTARNNWLRAMAQGKSLDEATRETLQLPFADLDKQWRASLIEPADAEKPKAEDTKAR